MDAQTQLPLPPATGHNLIPVAAYVRMSTEHQQYSTENQLDRVKEYAARRGMEIVRVFADEGKSGLSMKGRDSLRRMIAEVETGKTEFMAILAYDVSRWGRFQDADESGYYEYICKRAGIAVHYCAEQFENDGSPTSNIIKSVKRSMAGEYSRELSTKVFQGACRLIQMGFKQGGAAGFGLRRMLIDQAGQPKGALKIGEEGFEFRSTKDRFFKLPFVEVQTFFLSPRKLVIETFQNREHRLPGMQHLRFDLERAVPPEIAAELSTSVKGHRYSGPSPDAHGRNKRHSAIFG